MSRSKLIAELRKLKSKNGLPLLTMGDEARVIADFILERESRILAPLREFIELGESCSRMGAIKAINEALAINEAFQNIVDEAYLEAMTIWKSSHPAKVKHNWDARGGFATCQKCGTDDESDECIEAKEQPCGCTFSADNPAICAKCGGVLGKEQPPAIELLNAFELCRTITEYSMTCKIFKPRELTDLICNRFGRPKVSVEEIVEGIHSCKNINESSMAIITDHRYRIAEAIARKLNG